MESSSDDLAKKEAASFIRSYFEVGKNKDVATLMGFHCPSNLFTKFDENPPYTRQSSEEAFILEQAAFANISDYDYKIEGQKIDIIGGVAIATFYLSFSGVVVNDYSFEGMTIGSRSRVTMVLAKFDGGWRIVHAHISPYPDITKKEAARR